jgi:putative membrane protein
MNQPVEASSKLPSGLPLRCGVGGLLMGVANLVPGISGGAMLLILGVYQAFLEGIAAITSFRWKVRHFVVVGLVGAGAACTILLLAGVIRDVIVTYRWQAFSIVAGMRLAAIPVVWMMARRARRAAGNTGGPPATLWIGLIIGVLLTAAAASFTYSDAARGAFASGPVMHFAAGLLGASATILPGMDGSYILMLLGQYVPILGAIDEFAKGLKGMDVDAMVQASRVLIPTGIGVALGIGGVAIAMRWLLARFPQPTYGVLLGVLVGAFVGLYPFGTYRAPQVGDVVAGQVLTAETLGKYADDKDKWPLEFFRPSAGLIAASLGLVVLGWAVGWGLTKLEKEDERQ